MGAGRIISALTFVSISPRAAGEQGNPGNQWLAAVTGKTVLRLAI